MTADDSSAAGAVARRRAAEEAAALQKATEEAANDFAQKFQEGWGDTVAIGVAEHHCGASQCGQLAKDVGRWGGRVNIAEAKAKMHGDSDGAGTHGGTMVAVSRHRRQPVTPQSSQVPVGSQGIADLFTAPQSCGAAQSGAFALHDSTYGHLGGGLQRRRWRQRAHAASHAAVVRL